MKKASIQKLTQLRATMQSFQLDAYIIPSSDPHQSEYVADYWSSRKWLSGFTGSAGTLVVTKTEASLWTDSRYFLQAEEQLKDTGIELQKMVSGGGLQYDVWLAENLPPHSKVGIDGRLFSVNQEAYIQKNLAKNSIALVVEHDLISMVWKDRPELSEEIVKVHEVSYAGKSRVEKIAAVRAEMSAQAVDVYLVSALDEIAWLFNLRANDMPFNPVFYAYASVTKTATYLFINLIKIPAEIEQELKANDIQIQAYEDFLCYVQQLKETQTILLDPMTLSVNLHQKIKGKIIQSDSIIRWQKAIKNEVEIAHLRKTMEKDSVALLRLYRWLEKTLMKRTVLEVEVAEKLNELRSQQAHYQGSSFDAIVGYKSNGAIIHYRAMPETCAAIKAEGILLIDSGGQYLDGTTDITRTITLDKATALQQRNFTLVLKGHIALANARFPAGTNGVQLDTLARKTLWDHHLNYGHGTGHGVGFFLNVHEYPPSISPTASINRRPVVLKKGMLMSNEPGFYKKGAYGIRIENLILCVEDQVTEDFGTFLKFETLSLFPIDHNLILPELLSGAEIDWLNAYHEAVLERLSPYLETEEKSWLEEKCREVSK